IPPRTSDGPERAPPPDREPSPNHTVNLPSCQKPPSCIVDLVPNGSQIFYYAIPKMPTAGPQVTGNRNVIFRPNAEDPYCFPDKCTPITPALRPTSTSSPPSRAWCSNPDHRWSLPAGACSNPAA